MIQCWLEIAQGELGINERDNKDRIREYFIETGMLEYWEYDKVVDWCSIFGNFCLMKDFYPGTGSPAAISFLKYGIKLDEPREGCGVVLARINPLDWRSHFGFFLDMDKVRIKLLGGNQGNSVSKAWYLKARIRKNGLRWPATLNTDYFMPPRRDIFRGGYEQNLAVT